MKHCNSDIRMNLIIVVLLFHVFFYQTVKAQTHIFAQLKGTPIDTTGWNFAGAAQLGNIKYSNNSEVIVCPNSLTQSGAAFFRTPLNLTKCRKWIAEFDFRIYDGTTADGLAFCFLDDPPSNYVTGGGLGVPATANGLKVCFDSYPNCFPQNFDIYPKIELRWGVGYDECWNQPTVNNSTGLLNFIHSDSYNHARIIYNDGDIRVYVNDGLIITGYQKFNFTGYLGFTAATGARTDNHSLRNVIIYTDMPASEAGPDQSICSGKSAQLGTTSNAGYIYSWFPGAGLSSTSISNPYVTLTNTTSTVIRKTYYVQTFSSDSASCSSLDSVLITVNPGLQLKHDSIEKIICDGETFTLSSGGIVSSPGIYRDTLRSVTGCDSVATTIYVKNAAKPAVTISKSNDVDCALGFAKLAVTQGYSYLWSPSESLNNAHVYNPVAKPFKTTTYHVILTPEQGCAIQDSITVNVSADAGTNGYQLPNAFTPNGDGKNDCFGISKWGAVKDLQLSIYDRWGRLVFYTTNPADCWDGTNKGKPLQSDVFVYIVYANTVCGKIFRKGALALIR